MAKQLLDAKSLRRRLLAIVTLDHLQEQSVWNKLAPLLEADNAFLSLILDIIAIVYLRQYLQERVLESLPQKLYSLRAANQRARAGLQRRDDHCRLHPVVAATQLLRV